MSYNGYRKGHWISSALIVVLLLLLAAGVAFFFAREHLVRSKEPKKVETVPPTIIEVEKVVTGEAMQEKLRAAGELVTAEYASTEAGSYVTRRAAELFGQGVAVPSSRTNFLYCYEGTIRAGVDFSGVTVEKDDELKQITVRLPKAKIISSELAADSFRYLDDRTGVFNPIAVPSMEGISPILKENVEKRAVESGLLTRADEQARGMMRSLVEGVFGADGYTVSVESA